MKQVAIRLTDAQFVAIGQSYLRYLQRAVETLPVAEGREAAVEVDKQTVLRAIELSEQIDA